MAADYCMPHLFLEIQADYFLYTEFLLGKTYILTHCFKSMSPHLRIKLLNKHYMNSFDKQGADSLKTPKTVSKKVLLISILLVFVLLAGIWIWKEIEIINLREGAERDRMVLQDRAAELVVQSHEEHLKLLAKPFVWAIRSELLEGNISQVNLYTNEMVKEKNFKGIVVANNKGIIVSSTNKKDEGKDFNTVGKTDYLKNNNTIIDNAGDSLLVMSSPIMGFNNRLGTLMITYDVQQPELVLKK